MNTRDFQDWQRTQAQRIPTDPEDFDTEETGAALVREIQRRVGGDRARFLRETGALIRQLKAIGSECAMWGARDAVANLSGKDWIK